MVWCERLVKCDLSNGLVEFKVSNDNVVVKSKGSKGREKYIEEGQI